jgi:hypothetical protein
VVRSLHAGASDTNSRNIYETKVISTGRGGAGNIRSPSRDAIRVENGTPEGSPARSEQRGRGYDRDAIEAIDNANDNGVVREVYYRRDLSLKEQTLVAFVRPWWCRQHVRVTSPLQIALPIP